jgi:hypothetical protein
MDLPPYAEAVHDKQVTSEMPYRALFFSLCDSAARESGAALSAEVDSLLSGPRLIQKAGEVKVGTARRQGRPLPAVES